MQTNDSPAGPPPEVSPHARPKRPLYSWEVERAVLGAVSEHPELYAPYRALCDDFHKAEHARLFALLGAKHLDRVTVLDEVGGNAAAYGGMGNVLAIVRDFPLPHALPAYAQRLSDLAWCRRARELGLATVELAEAGDAEALTVQLPEMWRTCWRSRRRWPGAPTPRVPAATSVGPRHPGWAPYLRERK